MEKLIYLALFFLFSTATGLYTKHEDGSSMPCITAQCNSCGCSNGNIISTKRRCFEDSCFYYGVEYKHGSIIPKADGCNECTCSNGKADSCTKLPCPPSKALKCYQRGI